MSPRSVFMSTLVLFSVLTATHGTSLQVMNLQDMIDHSKTIFTGECVSVQSGVDSRGLPYTQYGFHVIEVFRGEATSRITVKQFGSSSHKDGSPGMVTMIAGMPEYALNETYLLFLGPRSTLGFSAPVGLFQGAFHLSPSRQLTNGLGNRNLTYDKSKGLPVRAALQEDSLIRGPVSYNRFKTVLQQLLRGEKIPLGSMATSLKGESR